MTETLLRALEVDDLAEIARVHQLAFPDSALTQLGLEAVRRYYEWQLTGPHDVLALGALQDELLVGFCFGGVFRGALSGYVRKNKGFLISNIITRPWLVLQQDFRSRVDLGLHAAGLFKRKTRGANQQPARGNALGVLSIAVIPVCQGTGVGKQLINACEEYARAHKYDRMRLSVHPDNQQAIYFYLAMGWEKDATEQSWHGKMFKMINNGREP